MKRIVALVWMTALLLSVGAARASEWREGLGPWQPYTAMPQVDLTEEVGYMMFYPNRGMPATTFCQTLFIYLPREDVKAGEGTLQLNTAKKSAVLTVAMNDAEVVRQRAMSEEELELWMWGGGTCFEIRLPRSLEFGQDYDVTLSKGCIVTADGVESPAIKDRNAWRITLDSDYGVGGLTYSAADGTADEATKELSFRVELGGEARSATLYSRDGSVDLPVTFFGESSQVTGTVTGETAAWGVMFFDAEGVQLDQLEF